MDVVRDVDGTQQVSEMESSVPPTMLVFGAIEHNYQAPECMERGDLMQSKVT